MDHSIKDALIKSINCIVDFYNFNSFSQLRQNTGLLKKIVNKFYPATPLRSIWDKDVFTALEKAVHLSKGSNAMEEPETCLSESVEENIKYICSIINRHYGHMIDSDEISMGCELEMGKLACLILNLLVTSKHAHVASEAVTNIQLLPNDVQMLVMRLIKVVVENQQASNLSSIISNTLCHVNEEEESNSQSSSPVSANDGSFLYGSPDVRSKHPSPLGKYFESPQYLYKKVLNENSQLRRTMNSKFDEKFELAERQIEDLKVKKRELEKERKNYLQRNHDLDLVVTKLNKDNEYLNNELGEKNGLISGQVKEIKSLKEEIGSIREKVENNKIKNSELEEKKALLEGEQKKFRNLLQQLTEAQEKYALMKEQHANVADERDHLHLQVEKLKYDHSDYVTNLKEEITRLEKQYVQREESQESIAEVMRREKKIEDLKDEIHRLKEQKKEDEDKNNERLTSHQKQTTQYMDQISALLKQVDEHSSRNETLNEKIQTIEKKYKQQEKEILKCEESAKEINEQIEQQSNEMKKKDKKISDLLADLETQKTNKKEEILLIQKNNDDKLIQAEKGYEEKINEYNKKMHDKDEIHTTKIHEKDCELASSRETCDKLNEEISQLNIILEKEKTDSCSQLENLTQEINQYRMKIDGYEKCQDKLNEDIDNLKDQNKLLDAQLVALKALKEEESNSSKEQGSQYLNQINMLLSQVNENSTRNEALNSKVATLEGKCSQLETEAETNNKTFADQVQQMNNDSDVKDNKIDEMTMELDSVKLKHAEKLSSLQSNHHQTVSELEELREKKAKSFQVELETARNEHQAALEHQSKLMRELTDEHEKIVNKKDFDIKSISETCHQLEENVSSLKLDCEKLQCDHDNQLKTLTEEHKNKIGEFEKSISAKIEELATFKNQNELLDGQLVALKTSKEEELDSQKKQNNQYMDQISLMFSQVNESSTRNETLSSKVVSLEAQCHRMESEAESLKKDFTEKLSIKAKEISRVESLLAETEEEKNSANEESKNLKQQFEELIVYKDVSEKEKCSLHDENKQLKERVEEVTLGKENIEKERCTVDAENKHLKVQIEELTSVSEKEKSSCNEENQRLKEQIDELVVNRDVSEKEAENSNVKATRLAKEVGELKTVISQKEMMIDSYGEQNKDICAQLESKLITIRELEEKIERLEEESFHLELSDSNPNRRKTFAVGTSNPRRETFAVETPSIHHLNEPPACSLKRNPSFKRKPYEPLDTIIQSPAAATSEPDDGEGSQGTESEPDNMPLSMADLDDSPEDFKPMMQPPAAPSRRDRKSIISLPIMTDHEELDDNNPLIRTFSLRDMKGRRRSVQPRRYMGGTTPPGRRTSSEDFMQISSFAVLEDEPEVMEWNMIKETKAAVESVPTEEDESRRIMELQRRNTLCLPHLRSAYPMELTVSTDDGNLAETTIRDGELLDHRKRKMATDFDTTKDFRKMKRSSLAQMNKPPPSFAKPAPPPMSNTFSQPETDFDQLAAKSAISFDIAFEPPKASKPKIGRKASTQSFDSASNETTTASSKSSATSFDIAFEPAKASKPKINRLPASSNLLRKDRTTVSHSCVNKDLHDDTGRKPFTSTGNLRKAAKKPAPSTTAATAARMERRLTQTFDAPSKELKQAVAQNVRRANSKPLREIKNNADAASRKSSIEAKDGTAGRKGSAGGRDSGGRKGSVGGRDSAGRKDSLGKKVAAAKKGPSGSMGSGASKKDATATTTTTTTATKNDDNLSRGGVKRSSFSKAKTRVAASLRAVKK